MLRMRTYSHQLLPSKFICALVSLNPVRQICNEYKALGARGISVIYSSGDGVRTSLCRLGRFSTNAW